MAKRRPTFAVASSALALAMIGLVGFGTASITAASTPKLALLSGSTAPIPAGDTVIGTAPSATTLSLDVALAPRDPAALSAEVNAVSNPASPQYRQYLAPGQFAQLYGPTSQV